MCLFLEYRVVCWGLYSYRMYNGHTISQLDRPFVEVEVDPDKTSN
jgi:hypothetical protein